MDTGDLFLALIGGPDALDRQTQGDMQAMSLLPPPKDDDRELFQKMGIKFGESANKLLLKCTLPNGWSVKRTDHHLYSNVIDERGMKRAMIMVHTMDRDSWIRPLTRFNADYVVDEWLEDGETVYIPAITESGAQRWRGLGIKKEATDERRRQDASGDHMAVYELARDVAKSKLDSLAPNWLDPLAYWGVDGDSIQFPSHETPPDERAKYGVRVVFRQGGRVVDEGDHASVKATSDEEAIDKLLAKVWRITNYDTEYWIFRDSDRKTISHGHNDARRTGEIRRRIDSGMYRFDEDYDR